MKVAVSVTNGKLVMRLEAVEKIDHYVIDYIRDKKQVPKDPDNPVVFIDLENVVSASKLAESPARMSPGIAIDVEKTELDDQGGAPKPLKPGDPGYASEAKSESPGGDRRAAMDGGEPQ